VTTISRFKIKLKTKIGKSKYSVLGRMPYVECRKQSSSSSYLEIFCCNALSTRTKVVDLLCLNYVVKKFRKSPRFRQSYENFLQQPVKFLKCDVARNTDFCINAVNKASYLEIFCCNALSTCKNVADLSILNDMVTKCRKSIQNWWSYDKFSDHV
jgi:hypothetical protein